MTATRQPNHPSPVEGLTRTEWLAERRKGLGGSDAAAILGLSPYASPLSVWMEKTDAFDLAEEQSEAMEWGLRLEPVIADVWSERTGMRAERAPSMLRHPDHPWMLCTIDRWVLGDDSRRRAVLEVKTANPFVDDWDFFSPLNPKIPDHVQVQCAHQLAVTGMDVCYGAVLIGGQQFETFQVDRDEEMIADLVTAEERWWTTHVLGGTPPPVDGSAATTEAIKSLFADSVDGTVVELPPDARALIDEWCEAKESVKVAKEGVDALANQLKILLGDAELGRVDGRNAVSYKSHPVREYTVAERVDRPLRLARGYKP